ncbi:alpha/beta hydrolase [Okibacterium endophyticum]
MNVYPEVHPADPSRGTIVFLHGGNVGNWMWEPQVSALPDFRVVTPDLPGFGSRTAEDWAGLDAVADDVVSRVEALAGPEPFHLVGLSLGGVVALRVLARHPGSVSSAFVTGAPLTGVHPASRMLAGAQLAFWDKRWFWQGQAAAFRLPEDSREFYVEQGMAVRKETARRMMTDVYNGVVPDGLSAYSSPLLMIAGEKESSVVRRSFPAVAAHLPGAQFRLAPGMHHIWSIEDVDLFNRSVRTWVEHGHPLDDLMPVP